jgi:hypothetical protein
MHLKVAFDEASYSSPPSGELRGSTLMPSRSGMRRTRRGRPETDFGSGSGCGLKLGGEGLKTCGIIVFPQENLTLLTEPNRAPLGLKAGPLCAAAARGDPGFCLRSIDCGTVLVPVPVLVHATFLVFPLSLPPPHSLYLPLRGRTCFEECSDLATKTRIRA